MSLKQRTKGRISRGLEEAHIFEKALSLVKVITKGVYRGCFGNMKNSYLVSKTTATTEILWKC